MDFLRLLCLVSFVAAVYSQSKENEYQKYFGAIKQCELELNMTLPGSSQPNENDKNLSSYYREIGVMCCVYKKLKWVVNGKYSVDENAKSIDGYFKIHNDQIKRRKHLTTLNVCAKSVESETNECTLVYQVRNCIYEELVSFDLELLQKMCASQFNISLEQFIGYKLDGELRTQEGKCALACLWSKMKLINNGTFSTEVAFRRLHIAVPNNTIILEKLKDIIDFCAKDVPTQADECTIAGIVGPCFSEKLAELQRSYPDAKDNQVVEETGPERRPSKRHALWSSGQDGVPLSRYLLG